MSSCLVRYLDLADELVVLVVLCVWEFVDLYLVLLYLFHYLTKGEDIQNVGTFKSKALMSLILLEDYWTF